ncbi:MAG: glycosyltransferase family 39 protein [Candidatus Sungbacteria bacterium]|uniref:Glycosyltransferase family 39 protein n=1 Tax=Candidatus Sungiibacteriota bacterium TaxID=2750080 RepID=A0A932YVI7_9BACT|nr:glycosyltransferase family 39 protein [Candidatus Sungbacteria bacterium]
MTIRPPYAVPALLLGIMFVLMLSSSWNDSATMDELAHVPAGYAYAFLQDYRLNPEHPPLIKMLAALPLIFTDIRFPTDTKSWAEDINGQWDQGRIFLYESENDADNILRLTRLPAMLLAVLLGWLLWVWVRRRFDARVANVALFFYAFSPTFLAHSRYVTTDLAAAFGFFIGIISFLEFLKAPSQKRIIIAGLGLGMALLLKFSLILFLPVYAILLLAWAASRTNSPWPERIRLLIALLAKVIVIAAVAIALVWLVYAYATWNYPAERQYRDAEFLLSSYGFGPAVDFTLGLIENRLTRPLGQYLLGLLMVIQRSSGGNTQYFLGSVSAAGDIGYFPILYLLKESAALHILSFIALWFAIRRILRASQKSPAAVLGWMHGHFPQFAAASFITVYWASSLSSPLNIGVRHVLPTFPFIYLLVAKGITDWLRSWPRDPIRTWRDWMGRLYQITVASLPRYVLTAILLVWLAASTIAAYPYYLSYYNFIAPLVVRTVGAAAPTERRSLPLTGQGGTMEGYRVAVDSNYDWGQDLKRLVSYTEANGIKKMRMDYFGGGSPSYYLGEKFEPWWSAKGYPPGGGWFAVSATFQMGAYGTPVKGFLRRPEDSYEWLKPFRPVARAGTSIFIYRLPEEPPPGL